jgi:uncharacterized protein
VLASHRGTGQAHAELRGEVENADTKQRLEDLYLPYKQKRRTKAQIAREAGHRPLAEALLADPTLTPEVEAEKYINAEKGFADTKAVLDGARQILMEHFAEDAALLGALRSVPARTRPGGSRWPRARRSDERRQVPRLLRLSPSRLATMPSHRALALFRGRNEGVLRLALDRSEKTARAAAEPTPASRMMVQLRHPQPGPRGRPLAGELARWTWSVKLSVHLELDLMNALRESRRAGGDPRVRRNLKDLLLAAPAGPQRHHGPRPRHPHRREGGGGRRHRQAGRHRHHLPARAAPRLERLAARAGGCAPSMASS